MLDLTSLERAVASLRRALDRADMAPEDEELRDAVVQRFEYTYELCWKMLRRQLQADAPSGAAVEALSFRALIRQGAESGLVRDVTAWFGYRDLRNLTVHTYDPETACRVRDAARAFHADASALLEALRQAPD